jgi:predicted enzyme related to lactoylglutathione lyase
VPAGIGYFVIHVPDPLRAKEFYTEVLDWRFRPDDHIDGAAPAGGISGGAERPRIDSYFLVEDAAATVARIRERGGTADNPARSPSGWSATCQDDQGGQFAIWQPSESYDHDGPPKGGEGDLFYFVLPVADDERAKRFYQPVFGWEFSTGTHPRGWNIVNCAPPGGLFGAGAPGRPDVYFRVADIESTLARVRAAGGTAGEAQTNKVGWHAACTDDQGVEFHLGALRES